MMQNLRLSRAILGTAVVMGLLATTPMPRANASSDQDPDQFLIVDCLLPGKVRRLGTRVTYVTARRAVKTTASKCGIRGGEYTAHDRANYATALNIWLPLAKNGDAAAQVSVAEIYEKGLGVPPQYDIAAQWYEKAAEQGLARAQLALGALYEQGLGVPQDKVKAVQWFRRASGLEAAGVEYVPASVKDELQELRSEREQLTQDRETLDRERQELSRERDVLKRQLQDVQRQLDDAKRQLRQRRGEAEEAGRRLSAARQDLEQQKQKAARAGDRVTADALEAKLKQNREESARRDRDLATLKSQVAALNDEASKLQGALKTEVAGRAADVARYRAEAEAAKAELARVTGRLKNSERELAGQRASVREAKAEFDRLRDELSHERNAAQRDDARIAKLQSELATREQELGDHRGRVRELSGAVASLQEEARQIEEQAAAEAARAKQEAAKAPPVIVMIDPVIQQTRASGMPAVRVRSVGKRLIIGRVEAASGLTALIVNDAEQKLAKDGLFRVAVPVQFPETPVNIVAIDGRGRRTTLGFTLRPEGETKTARAGAGAAVPKLVIPDDIEFGTFHALVIGNNDYAHLPKLKSAVVDANAVATLLQTKYGFKTTLLQNGTRYQILSALNKLREELTDDDNLLIYYAGHGELDRVNNRGNWLPVDAEPNSTANWISNIQITDVLNAMSAQQVMVVADSCYSGTMTRAALASIDAGMSEKKRTDWIRVMANKRARVVLSSGGVQPVLDSGGGEHSVFAQAFLAALGENAQILDGQRLYRTVSQAVATSAAGASVDQVPQFAPIKFAGHEAGDFFFIPAN